MEIGVVEAADLLGVSPRRVRVLAEAGRVPARRVGRVWLIDDAGLHGAVRSRRPLSVSMVEALLQVLSTGANGPLTPRLRARLADLVDAEDPAGLLRSWLADAAPRVRTFAVPPGDLADLARDARLVTSGVSDPRCGLAAVGLVEARVEAADLPDVVAEFWMRADLAGNVRLLESDRPVVQPQPLGLLLADLSLHPGPREKAAVRRLLGIEADRLRRAMAQAR